MPKGFTSKRIRKIQRYEYISSPYSKTQRQFFTIYYLAGDEDRAVKRFVDVNAAELSKVNLQKFSVIDSGLPREMAQKIRGAMH